MDLKEYQEAAYSTCTPECYTHEYLTLGLISERGEIAGKLAKRVRGDHVPDEDIMQEIGDVAWMVAVKARLDGETLELNRDMLAERPLKTLIWQYLQDVRGVAKMSCLVSLSKELGIDFQAALDANIKKLESRQRRGVIQGNGDNR